MARKKVLQDHKRRGKTLIPPFTHALGPLLEVSWVKTMLPELLWIALVQDCYGYIKGVALITSIARAARRCSLQHKQGIFATISSFVDITSDEMSCLQGQLAASGDLLEIQNALLPLVAPYPECPLRLLYSAKPERSDKVRQDIVQLKKVVEGLYDRTSKDTMMVQAAAIWLAFDSGVLRVSEGLTLASFPEVEKYPDTELSRKVAAAIRASMFVLFYEDQYPVSGSWAGQFWNRGLEFDACYFEDTPDE